MSAARDQAVRDLADSTGLSPVVADALLSDHEAKRREQERARLSPLRVYLAGAVDKLPDLGTGWRREVDTALEAAGMRAVWPEGLGLAIDSEYVRDAWAHSEPRNRVFNSLGGLLQPYRREHGVDALLVRWCDACGLGTRAEVAVARWAKIPLVWYEPAAVEESGPAEDGEPYVFSLDAAIAALRQIAEAHP